METAGWNTILFILKWILTGLVYIALGLVILAVRAELRLRIGPKRSVTAFAPGRLKVIAAGGDPNLRYGELINLQPENTLGTDPASDIVVQDQFASAHHARVRWDGTRWWLDDMGSRNGTLVNGVQIRPGQPQPLTPGTTFSVGSVTFEFLE